MSQAEPLSQAGDPNQNVGEPLQMTVAVDETPTMERRSNLRVSLVMMALA
ncbi:hypothetical protein NHJ13734_004738, partial [Beauveria thailandica]